MRRLLVFTLVCLAGCAAALKAAGFPPQALRKAPPAGVEGTALAVGATAPDVTVPLTDGTTAGVRGAPTVLLFYRGHW
mgnify:CR=1 FL=1